MVNQIKLELNLEKTLQLFNKSILIEFKLQENSKMAPAVVWHPNLRFEDTERNNNSSEEDDSGSMNEMTFWYFVFLIGTLVLWLLIYFVLRIISISNYYFIYHYTKNRDPNPHKT